MHIKTRLTILNFLEFFSWGAWLLSAGAYMSTTLGFTGVQIGSVYATLGIASIFMPPVIGIIADRWIPAEKLFGISHLLLAGLFVVLTSMTSFNSFYMVTFLVALVYMPTLALSNSISYYNLEKEGLDSVVTFPPIRVWGTVGFIIAAWLVDVLGLKVSHEQFYLAAAASVLLGGYSFSLPLIPIVKNTSRTLFQRFGLDAFVLFKNKNLAIFLVFSVLLGAALQITNIWGVPFLNDFSISYKDSFVVKHAVFLMSLSQVSEVLFILAIPFFLKRFGIKIVVLISMFAWVFRFGFFGVGSPEGMGLLFLITSMIIYGMAFDFYVISGSLYVDKMSDAKVRSSAQGLFMMMVNGFGAVLGAYISGFVVDYYTANNGIKDWASIWFICAVYALIIGVLFALVFRYKHTGEENLVIKK
ncbi:nucleoside permease [Aquimarina hainanensis]|uniref:Nucleoside permease n=1 Tax=Aquimarina hainanensis TaxID=1578017 RepID=A0ABW5N780_9FLAO|nr:nucleoside permease [Aquimarina sp. TRL1]QKX07595.1 nucleoside permease [Aquimarina sp. TRL1]